MESGGVEIEAKKLVNRLETSSISSNGVVGRSEPVCVLVPWRGTWEDGLDEHSGNVHVAKSACPDGQCTGRTPDEHAATDDDGRHIVDDSVRQPGEQVEDYVLVGGQDVAQIGTV